jgi:hypothetical protein
VTVKALSPLTEPWLTKRQLAAHYGRSLWWVEERMRHGLPHRKDTPTAWPLFRLSEADAWLAEQSRSR